ncbi:MAG: glycosyltransferase family 39 protein [Chloroflexi bacterium]|nr:glycosyltransferase family 39 protein [Chloroflexota bacterium]
MTSRMSFWLALLLLLIAAALRLSQLAQLPPGLQAEELTDIRLADSVRRGQIEVFYNLGTEGREGLYHTTLAAVTAAVGGGMIGFHILSVWLGMLTLALVYALAARLYGPLPGAAALAILALSFFPTLLARTISRETVVPLLVAGALLAIARAFPVYQQDRRHRQPTTIPFAALGIVLGLSFYTHPVAFAITLFSVAFIIYMLLSRQPMGRRMLNYTSFAMLVLMIITVPYLLSTIREPDLGGAARLFQAYSASVRPFLETLWAAVSGLLFIGDRNPAYNLPGRPLIDLVSGFIVVIGVISALRYWRLPRYALPLIAAVALLPSVLLATDSPYFPSYAPLLPLIALFFAVGVKTLYSSLRRSLRRVALLALLALLAFNLVWTARDLFVVWPQTPAVQEVYNGGLNAIASYLDRTVDSIPTVLCAPALNPFQDSSDETTPLLLEMMHRADTAIRFADCLTGLVLANGGDAQQIVLPDPALRAQMAPALQAWLDMGVPLNERGIPPGAVILLDVSAALADTVGRFTTTLPVTYAPEAPGGDSPTLLPVSFGGNITFLGYEPQPPRTFRPSDTVTVVTYWRIDGLIPPDILLFTHILADPASVDAQRDVISVRADHVFARDVLVQVTYVVLPETLIDGRYAISVGAYQNEDQQRMVVLDNGQPRGDRLFLDFITVAR